MESQKPTNANLNNGQDAIYNDEYLKESLKNLFTEHSNQNQHCYLSKWSSPNFQIRTVKQCYGWYYLFIGNFANFSFYFSNHKKII